MQPNRTVRTRPTHRLLDMKRVSSGSPLEGQIGFSRAVRVGNFIAVAGTAPIPIDSSNHTEQFSTFAFCSPTEITGVKSEV